MGCLRPNAVIEVGFNTKSQSGIRSAHSPPAGAPFLDPRYSSRRGTLSSPQPDKRRASRRIDAQAHRTDVKSNHSTHHYRTDRRCRARSGSPVAHDVLKARLPKASIFPGHIRICTWCRGRLSNALCSGAGKSSWVDPRRADLVRVRASRGSRPLIGDPKKTPHRLFEYPPKGTASGGSSSPSPVA
jgi:hypothetical protein